jgi:hypothetical protein
MSTTIGDIVAPIGPVPVTRLTRDIVRVLVVELVSKCAMPDLTLTAGEREQGNILWCGLGNLDVLNRHYGPVQD